MASAGIALAGVASLGLAGCGDGGSSPAPAPTPTIPAPTPTPTPTPPPVDSLTLPADPAATTLTVDPAAIASRGTPVLLGVGTHFSGGSAPAYDPEHSAAVVNATGLSSFRDDIFWPAFDPQGTGASILPGKLTSFLSQTSATPLLILNRGNPNVAGTFPPFTEAGIAAFAEFSQRVVRTMGNRAAVYEIWNEWNFNGTNATPLQGPGAPSDPRASIHYVPLALAASRAIKAIAPDTKVVVGGAGNDPGWQWSRDVVARGALAHADGFSVHLYNHCAAPTSRSATEMIDRLGTLRTILTEASAGREVPVYVTEWGWPTADQTCGGVPDTIAGPNIAQFSLFLAGSPWIGGGWLYELKDQVANSLNREHNFGLVGANYAEKPRTCFYREAMALIGQAQAMTYRRIAPDIMSAQVRTASGLRLIAWTTATKTVTAQITVGGSISYSASTICSQATTVSGRTVQVGASPVIINVDASQPVAFQIKAI